jgi:hypothetical protein
MEGMRKTIWIVQVLVEIQTECLPNTSEICHHVAVLANPGGYNMSKAQECGEKLAQTMARDHVRDTRTHHASHREYLLPLYDHVDCDRHASGRDGRTSVSC